jgi:hypothetical protein
MKPSIHSSTTRRDLGCTGLGLHIVHNIVTSRLGGRLDLQSDPGNGTRIQMILPRVAPERENDERTDLAYESPKSSARQLLAQSGGFPMSASKLLLEPDRTSRIYKYMT